MLRSPYAGPVRALILDWAGTAADHGSRAPMGAFVRAFAAFGVPIGIADARGPMGIAKRDHIAAVLRQPRAAAAWLAAQGTPPDEAAIDRVLQVFEPLNVAVIPEHADLIPGVAEAVAGLRERGIRVAATTGYTRPILEVLEPIAARQGYAPEFTICAGETAEGRPAPLMMWAAMARLGVWPAAAVVKIDDTPVGMEEGRNAGAWCVGVALSGNIAGLSVAELAALAEPERDAIRKRATAELIAGGAHLVIDSAADLLRAIGWIEARLGDGTDPASM